MLAMHHPWNHEAMMVHHLLDHDSSTSTIWWATYNLDRNNLWCLCSGKQKMPWRICSSRAAMPANSQLPWNTSTMGMAWWTSCSSIQPQWRNCMGLSKGWARRKLVKIATSNAWKPSKLHLLGLRKLRPGVPQKSTNCFPFANLKVYPSKCYGSWVVYRYNAFHFTIALQAAANGLLRALKRPKASSKAKAKAKAQAAVPEKSPSEATAWNGKWSLRMVCIASVTEHGVACQRAMWFWPLDFWSWKLQRGEHLQLQTMIWCFVRSSERKRMNSAQGIKGYVDVGSISHGFLDLPS